MDHDDYVNAYIDGDIDFHRKELEYTLHHGPMDWYQTYRWPRSIVSKLMDPRKKRGDRWILFVFLVGNGMDPEVAGYYITWWYCVCTGRFTRRGSDGVEHTEQMIREYNGGKGRKAIPYLRAKYWDMDLRKTTTMSG